MGNYIAIKAASTSKGVHKRLQGLGHKPSPMHHPPTVLTDLTVGKVWGRGCYIGGLATPAAAPIDQHF